VAGCHPLSIRCGCRPGQRAKEALLADDPGVFFTTPNFDGYPAVLVRLDRIGAAELEELIVEAWLDRAPTRFAKQYLDGRRPG
jgi:hypothetical protein